MLILIHSLFAAFYVVLALAAALVLPDVLPQVSPLHGVVAGAAVLVGGLAAQFIPTSIN